jgi:hypothetical protein
MAKFYPNAASFWRLQVSEGYAARNLTVHIKRNRCNTGPIANIQRALWFGDADYAMPNTSDDLIATNYVERLMGVLLAHHDWPCATPTP